MCIAGVDVYRCAKGGVRCVGKARKAMGSE